MDIPNFRDILQKLSVFKNNVSLLVSVIIGLVSILLFIPTQLMSGRLKGQIQQESISKGSRIRTLPPVSREQWREEEKRQIEYANDANEIAKLAKQSTQRELLSYEIFPKPTDLSTLIFKKFGQRFREGVDELIARANAGDCPTDVEIKRGVENSSGIRGTRGGRMGPSMGPPMGGSMRPSMIRASRNPLMNPYGGGGMYGMMGEVRRTIID